MSTIVVPAIIAQTQSELDDMLEKLRGKAHRVMLDIMDGRFVESESLNFDFKLPSHFEYEAHLMVEDPLNLVQSLIDKVHIVILHVETLDNIEAAINQVKSNGLKVVLALNPESDVSILYPYLEKIDGVLVMTVKPGKYGGSFLPEILDKARKIVAGCSPKLRLEKLSLSCLCVDQLTLNPLDGDFAPFPLCLGNAVLAVHHGLFAELNGCEVVLCRVGDIRFDLRNEVVDTLNVQQGMRFASFID